MGLTRARRTPFYLRGNFAPVREEITVCDLPVTGKLPRSLNGLFVRNGPNPRGGDPGHWFLGDGMLHGVRLEDGRALWYRNRWVRTRYLEDPGARVVTRTGRVDLRVAKANTHVVAHAGRLLALVESSYPTEIDAELGTLGPTDLDGALGTAFTAHPKRCPQTGELHLFGYGFRQPHVTYHRLDCGGRLVRSVPVRTKGAGMMHDFAITRRHVVFLDLPIVLDVKGALLGRRFPFRWREDYGARLGVMPRDGERVRWLEVAPGYAFHVLNAWEDATSITLDVVRYERLWQRRPDHFPPASLHRYHIDLEGDRVAETALDERPVELPRIDPRRQGLRHRYGYVVETGDPEGTTLPTRLHRYDLERSEVASHDLGHGRTPGEPVFVPAHATAAEDEGWVLTYVYDGARNASDLAVLDAGHFDAAPVALVHLPCRVPFGFHGSWVADGELAA
jgi:carotenoid cleavage dioxygenase